MKITRFLNLSCEYEMQDKMAEWITDLGYPFKAEVRVPEVGRIADFLMIKPGNGLINIEAKCSDYAKMLKQMDDHAQYCDYSYAFITDYSLTPRHIKTKIAEKGYGLIVYNNKHKVITEVFEAHHNKPKMKELRSKNLKLLKQTLGL